MASIFIRTVIMFIILSLIMKVMGKRQIGELEVGELVSTVLMSEIAGLPISDPDIPLLNAIIPIAFIFSSEVILSIIKNKWVLAKRTIEGEPSYIIYRGRLLQKTLYENRISINELLSELRLQGVYDIKDVEYAIVEPSGKLSVMKCDEENKGGLAHTVIIDGEIVKSNLKSLDITDGWIRKILNQKKLSAKDVFLMTVNDKRDINIILKEEIS
jgi:uncharacterized membrane protein YcaP (DUF421 family)